MLKSLRLQNYRSYSDQTFNFSAGVNIIVGPNAAGKTNILEAILLSRIGASYRARDIDLIAFNKLWARLDSIDDETERTIKIDRQSIPAKTIEINQQIYKRLPARLKLPVVLFEPNHLQLLNGPPDGRRAYLDGVTQQIEVEYGLLLRKYLRSLAQRNSLLKQPSKPTSNQLFPWNIRLSQLGGQLAKYRSAMVKQINSILPAIYTNLSNDKIKTSLLYKPQFAAEDYESHYLKKLETELNDDLRSGFTGYGPHRDDFSFMFGAHPSNVYASRGELRTAVLALKVAELTTIKDQTTNSPVLLLDDVYSELDNARRQALTNYLDSEQSFITTTNADLVLKNLKTKNQVIKL